MIIVDDNFLFCLVSCSFIASAFKYVIKDPGVFSDVKYEI